MTRPGRLAYDDRASLDANLAASPEPESVAASVRAFTVIMNERRGTAQLPRLPGPLTVTRRASVRGRS
jgi:hypothetical protein